MRCFYCKSQTEEGLVRCKECKEATNTPTVAFRGKNWASNSNTERLNRWNKHQSPENKKTDMGDIGMI